MQGIYLVWVSQILIDEVQNQGITTNDDIKANTGSRNFITYPDSFLQIMSTDPLPKSKGVKFCRNTIQTLSTEEKLRESCTHQRVPSSHLFIHQTNVHLIDINRAATSASLRWFCLARELSTWKMRIGATILAPIDVQQFAATWKFNQYTAAGKAC